MPTRLTPLQERILLELSGRGRAVSVRDLCHTIGMDYSDWQKAYRDLYLGDMIKRQFGYPGHDEEWFAITWIGEDWLANRPKPSVQPQPKRRWYQFAPRIRAQK